MLHLGLGRAAALGRCGLLPGDVDRSTPLGDFKAEGLADIHLGAHERGVELHFTLAY